MPNENEWTKICAACAKGTPPERCAYYGEPNGCNAPTLGKHPEGDLAERLQEALEKARRRIAELERSPGNAAAQRNGGANMSDENEVPIDIIIREISADADAGNLVAWTPLGLRQLSYRIAEATMLEREMLRCATAQVRELKARVRELEAHADPAGPARNFNRFNNATEAGLAYRNFLQARAGRVVDVDEDTFFAHLVNWLFAPVEKGGEA